MTEGFAAFAMLRFLAFCLGLETLPSTATPQALRASSPSRGAFKSSTHKGMATHAQLKLRFAAHLAGEPLKAPPTRGWQLTRRGTSPPKPPLLGEVARRSRDGGVCGLCHVEIFGFFPRARSSANRGNPSGAARQLHPQGDGDSRAAEAAVRCSPSRGAFKSSTHKGMATHAQGNLAPQASTARGGGTAKP